MSSQAIPMTKAAQCDGKQPFASHSIAIKVASRLGNANAYRCPHCHQFHVGHKAPRPPFTARREVVRLDGFED